MQPESLDALLDLLSDEGPAAGEAYRVMHQRLTRFFRLNSGSDPESLADEAINRLAAIASKGAISIESPTALALGIARHLLQEDIRKAFREAATVRHFHHLQMTDGTDKEQLLQTMEDCMATLSPDRQQILKTYYQWTGRQKIQHHRQLAKQLGVNLNALRNRLMRARGELDACVRARLRDVPSKTGTPGEGRNGGDLERSKS